MSSAIQRLVDSRWFCAIGLACAALAGFWWYSQPAIGGCPLLVALAPWAFRQFFGRPPIRHAILDALVVVFLLTALVGVWAGYDRTAAWSKFWILVGAALINYALATQPQANLWPVTALLGALGAVIAAYFLLTYDWQALPRHFADLDRIGIWWMSIRPTFSGFIFPNVAGGLLAMFLPFAAAAWTRGWQERLWRAIVLNTVTGGLILIGLILTSSRGAWGALALALAGWSVWALGGYAAGKFGWRRQLTSGLLLLLAASAGTLVVFTYPGGLLALAQHIPDGESRYLLAYNSMRLVGDYAFTGGGLAAFNGLYSRYVLVIFVPYYTYSHDLFLDVILEQGVLGLVALVSIMFGSLILLARHRTSEQGDRLLRWALMTAIVVVGLHGLLDDALYGNQGTPLLFILSGLTVALTRPGPNLALRGTPNCEGSGVSVRIPRGRSWALGLGATVLGAALLFLCATRLAGAWLADLGSVYLGRVELAGWPNSRWDQTLPDASLRQAQQLFELALNFDPANRTAHQRLGFIAGRAGNYPLAISHLEAAYRVDPGSRAVIKELGDDYVWLGQLERARPLLASVPEAAEQMDAYAWWWNEHGRADRSSYAAQMAALLRTGESTRTR